MLAKGATSVGFAGPFFPLTYFPIFSGNWNLCNMGLRQWIWLFVIQFVPSGEINKLIFSYPHLKPSYKGLGYFKLIYIDKTLTLTTLYDINITAGVWSFEIPAYKLILISISHYILSILLSIGRDLAESASGLTRGLPWTVKNDGSLRKVVDKQ